MYIVKRDHTIPYFAFKKNGIVSWSSRAADAYGYKTIIGAATAATVLKYITGDNSIVITKGLN